jgi:hypothetical protein
VIVFQPSKGLSTYEKLEVLRSSDTAAKRLPTMSRAQVSTFLGKLPADSAGTISFHDLQECVAVDWLAVACVCAHVRCKL